MLRKTLQEEENIQWNVQMLHVFSIHYRWIDGSCC